LSAKPDSDADAPKYKHYEDREPIPSVDREDIKRFWKVKTLWRKGNDI
jgi:hypothetical protein